MARGSGVRRGAVRLALAAAPLLLLALHALSVLPLEFVDRLENYLYDVRVRLTAPGGVDPRVVIVDVDERSLAVEGHWPWRRDRIAALLNQLFDHYGVAVAGFDMVFPEQDQDSALALVDELRGMPAAAGLRSWLEARRGLLETDRRFAEALIARDVVLGVLFKQRVAPGEPATVGVLPAPVALGGGDVSGVTWTRPVGYTGNLAALQDNAATAGFFDTPLVDEDGKVRRTPLFQRYEGRLYESLALATARLALGSPPLRLAFARSEGRFARLEFVELGPRRIPVDPEAAVLVPFRGGVGSFPYVSATDVLKGTVPPEVLAGRIVLVGTSAPGLADIRPTPVSKEFIGVEAHANLVAGMLDGSIRFRPAAARAIELATLALLAVACGLWLPRLSPLAGFAWVAAALATVAGLNLLAWWRAGLWLPLASAVVLVLAAAVLEFTYGYLVETRRKRRLSRLFGQYVPPELVEEMDRSEAEVSLEGENREMTVLFSDVRGFTTLSERLDPRELTRLMNEFLTPITETIQQHRGTIDKYMGDAVMAFWGAPLPDPRHAEHALRAALGMVAKMQELGAAFRARGWPEIRIGVGLSTGPMNVGNMGSRFRMAYTVLGDTVNLGSRIEGLTKQYGVDVAVSEATARAVPGFAFRELDRVRVKGKHEPVAILEPLGPAADLADATRRAAADFAAALAAYRAQRWDESERYLRALHDAQSHSLYALYLDRVRHFRAEPPPPDWDGVWVHTSK
jgi:adenylate cyclase